MKLENVQFKNPQQIERYFINDYPILCYYQYTKDNDESKSNKLVFYNMARLEETCEQKLDKEFICFIESKSIEHTAEINVLLKSNASADNQYCI